MLQSNALSSWSDELRDCLRRSANQGGSSTQVRDILRRSVIVIDDHLTFYLYARFAQFSCDGGLFDGRGSEAAHRYAEAYGAHHPEAAERLDTMISNYDARRPRADAPTADPVSAPGTEADTCRQGGLEKAVNGNDLATASAHFRQCTACQREFLGRGGILPQLARPQ